MFSNRIWPRLRAVATAFSSSVLFSLFLPPTAMAERAAVAVTHDFSAVMKQIAAEFRDDTGHQLNVIAGSAQMLSQQIKGGAPYDVFLAQDQQLPHQLEEAGLTVPDSRYTYAVGRLALWSADRNGITVLGSKLLREGDFARLAIVSPEHSAYGRATMQALTNLQVAADLDGKLFVQTNLKRVYRAVEKQQAELGVIAVSQLIRAKGLERGSRWNIPSQLHDQIRQDVVLLKRGENNAAALLFMSFLRSVDTQARIRSMGYSLAD